MKHLKSYFLNHIKTKHSYHLVDPSPWPILGSLGAFCTTVGGVLYMHKFSGGWFLFLSIIFTMFGWWQNDKAGIGESKNSESWQNKNKPPHNKFLRSLCDNFILFTHWTLVKQKNPTSILMFVLSPVLAFQSFYLLKIYLVILISNAIFIDICYRVSFIGHPVCAFLKNYATPELFLLIGNHPFEALFAKLSGPAVKSIAKPVLLAAGVGLGADYVASTGGFHQLGCHAAQDAYNGEKTYYKHDHNLNRSPYLDRLIENAQKK